MKFHSNNKKLENFDAGFSGFRWSSLAEKRMRGQAFWEAKRDLRSALEFFSKSTDEEMAHCFLILARFSFSIFRKQEGGEVKMKISDETLERNKFLAKKEFENKPTTVKIESIKAVKSTSKFTGMNEVDLEVTVSRDGEELGAVTMWPRDQAGMAKIHGPETNDWIGKEIKISSVEAKKQDGTAFWKWVFDFSR